MNKIIFPLKPGNQGGEVGDLQDALQAFLDRAAILPDSPDERKDLSANLKPERIEKVYQDFTEKLVAIFQKENDLSPTGTVDEESAKAINTLLSKLGLLDQTNSPISFVVNGAVTQENGIPKQDIKVRAFHEDKQGVFRLGEDTTDADGRYTILYELLPEVTAINLRVQAISVNGKVLKSSEIVKKAKRLVVINLSLPLLSSPTTDRRIEGRIMFEYGLPAGELKLKLYQQGFGVNRKQLQETQTDKDGNYLFQYQLTEAAHIQIYAIGTDGKEEVPLSKTKFDAAVVERIDLIAPASLKLPDTEFTRLKLAVSQHTGNKPEMLKDAVEREGRRDFTYLANATGWDIAALALASEAFELEAQTKIPAEGLYALARAGLPTDNRKLASIPRQTVDSVLRRAAEAGIVTDAIVEESSLAFAAFSSEFHLSNKVIGANSSPKDFIAKAKVSEEDRKAFTGIIVSEIEGNLWERAKEAGVSDEGIQILKLQGKLAYLTFNNVELVEYLVSKVSSDLLVLIELGFYENKKWEDVLREIADNDAVKLGTLIPPAFDGQTIEERMANYTEELARRVRQMDSHAVTVDRIAAGKIEGLNERENVIKFLKNAIKEGFRLGNTPLSSFIAKHRDVVLDGIEPGKVDAVIDSVSTLSSLYSISPNDESLNALIRAGYSSATAIARNDYVFFRDRVQVYLTSPKAGDIDVTEAIFWKAQQQSATVFNVFDGLKRLNSVSSAPGSSPDDIKKRDDQIKKTREKLNGLFPTLETLFGSVDYCECNQCQSVLSPAAYLVDILHFIDPTQEAWASALAAYKARTGVAYSKKKPFDAINDRRPDIKNIALTCENTNTALPYIDIVNEVLEQLMMSDQVPPQIEAYDVGEATSEDLVAEPQNILWSAYVGTSGKSLREQVYPVNLPFDLPLEMVRSFLRQLDLPLWRLRECLEQPQTLADWTKVWFERLGLGTSDINVLTRSNNWYELYGYPSQNEALKTALIDGVNQPAETSLLNAKTLARRLDVSYVELVELIRTRFINPEIENLIVLKRLGIDTNTLDRYLGIAGSAMDNSEKAEFETYLTVQGVTKNDLIPLRSEAIRKATLVLQSPNVGCDFAKTTLAFEQEPADVQQAFAFVLLKMNALVRLKKKLGWEIHELDRLLMAVMPGVTTLTATSWPAAMKTTLIYLSHIEELKERFENRLSREEIVIFWSDIPTKGISCLYERLFLSPGIPNQDKTFNKKLGRVLEDNTILLEPHSDAILRAFQLAHDAIESILSLAAASDRILSVKNLSILMRYSALAKGLNISVPDLLTLIRLSERSPLPQLGSTQLANLEDDLVWKETLAFVQEVELISEANVNTAFLERICRHINVNEQPSKNEDPLMIALAALPPVGTVTGDDRYILILKTLSAQLSAPEAIIAKLLADVLKDSAGQPLEVGGFSNPANTEASIHKLRMTLDLIQSLAITVEELQYLISQPDALNPNDLPVALVTSYADAKRLRKGLLLWLELVVTRKQFGRSERILAVIQAAKQPIDANHTYGDREKQLHEAMLALTGIKLPGLKTSLEAIGAKSDSTRPDFEVPLLNKLSSLRKVIEALKCFARIKLSPTDMVRFATSAIDVSVAQQFRSSLKGSYSASAWRSLVKPIFDELRKKQRDALVSHLTHVMESGLPKYGETPEKLFEYLLLDSGMEPVVIASRIQLAIASVQLFVQRCLMNLEKDVDPQIIDVKRWEWMRRYRVWEVNRKMFIWPENWLDPEFRDDKTHLFRELEGKLLQGDVNDDLVRNSLNTYLKGLEEIARLQMLTMYFEPGISADGSIIHVVGRTMNSPHKYFYRKLSHGMWTPWEPIDVGIEGEHLVLTSWRGRMHLFWLSFLEQAKESSSIPASFKPGTDTVSTKDLRGSTQVSLQLHWVEQVQGNWVNRNSTSGFVDTDFFGQKATTNTEKQAFFVRAVLIKHAAGVEDDDLEIHITNNGKAHKFVFFSKLATPRSEKNGVAPLAPPYHVNTRGEATKWQVNDSLQVKFVSAITQNSEAGSQLSGDGYHKILVNGKDSSLLFPSNESLPVPARTPSSGVGRASGYFFRPQNAEHVAYRSTNGSIFDLFKTKNGWFYQSPSVDVSSSGAAGDAQPAMSDPYGYSIDDRGTICIAYAGMTKIHELVWSQLDSSLNDETLLSTGWRIETLYQAENQEDQPIGRPLGGMFLPNRGVVFRTKDGKIKAVEENPSQANWIKMDLNSHRPIAVCEPSGILITNTKIGIKNIVSQHVFYIGGDGNIHELHKDFKVQNWSYRNITKDISGFVKPKAQSNLSAHVFLANNSVHIVYRGTDDKIHELRKKIQAEKWQHESIGNLFKKAKGDPVGFVSESHSAQHVVYLGIDNDVVELCRYGSGSWKEDLLSTTVANASSPSSDIVGYTIEPSKSKHIVYFAADGSPHELLSDNTKGWQSLMYELNNPFPDDLGQLASPFFYESANKDHTFFVEPYIIETAVHEWREWIVTTKEYQEIPTIDFIPFPLIPLIPLIFEPIIFIPNGISIIPSYKQFANKAFGEDVMVRTSKNFIISNGTVNKIIDARSGQQLIENYGQENGRQGGLL